MKPYTAQTVNTPHTGYKIADGPRNESAMATVIFSVSVLLGIRLILAVLY